MPFFTLVSPWKTAKDLLFVLFVSFVVCPGLFKAKPAEVSLRGLIPRLVMEYYTTRLEAQFSSHL